MTHSHVCACGAVLTCTRERDQCAVGMKGDWTCPSCELDQRDEYFRQQSAVAQLSNEERFRRYFGLQNTQPTQPVTEQEPTRHESE